MLTNRRKKELLTKIAHKTGKKRDDVRIHCGGTDCGDERNYDKRREYLYKRIRQLRYKKNMQVK